MRWHHDIGLDPAKLRWHAHGADELAHYAKAAYDVVFEFPFGWHELEGVHHRGDFDLRQHSEHSGKDQSYTDPEAKERYFPYVVETSVGVDRCLLALLCSAYSEDEVGGEKRVVLRFTPQIAPIKVAVLPLSKKLAEPARSPPICAAASRSIRRLQRDRRRYRRQDEIGTPFCVTYDFESEQDQKATVRERDTTKQERIALSELPSYLSERILG
jgi:glycyl-tRNA synthetase